jgi:hypothetical protein
LVPSSTVKIQASLLRLEILFLEILTAILVFYFREYTQFADPSPKSLSKFSTFILRCPLYIISIILKIKHTFIEAIISDFKLEPAA